jgi:hypothetical protein
MSDKDKERLQTSLQYHKLFLQSKSDDLRLVNLWIALESLFLGEEGKIIVKILEYIPKINTTNYIYRQLRAITISMGEYWKKSDTEEIRKKLIQSNKYRFGAYDLLKILLNNDEELEKKFTELIISNPLLLFRIERYSTQYFKNKKSLKSFLESHKLHIEWQIQRIYRARNQIVHKGLCPSGIRLLIKHLHSYLILAMHNIVHDLKNNNDWNLGEALESRSLLYDHFIEVLKEENTKPLTVEQIYSMEKCLESSDDELAWVK